MCVSRDDCIKNTALIYETKKICLQNKSCSSYDWYLYHGTGGDECVSAEDCLKEKKGHAYANLEECIQKDPIIDENFAERDDNVYSCKIEDWFYVSYYLWYITDTVRCVSNAKCYMVLKGINYESQCISRE